MPGLMKPRTTVQPSASVSFRHSETHLSKTSRMKMDAPDGIIFCGILMPGVGFHDKKTEKKPTPGISRLKIIPMFAQDARAHES